VRKAADRGELATNGIVAAKCRLPSAREDLGGEVNHGVDALSLREQHDAAACQQRAFDIGPL
jgi:hypothetical protein